MQIFDHKPLLSIFNHRDLESIQNPRLQTLKENTFSWRFNVTYNPGKWHKGVDALSRNPATAALASVSSVIDMGLYDIIQEYPTNEDHSTTDCCDELLESAAVLALYSLCKNVINLDDIRSVARKDESYTDLINIVQQGFPTSKRATSPTLRE